MGKPGDQTPEIPGFQPLHIRGAGRLGIWMEARQVRLDRRVLLKVLPAAEHDLQQEFIREVQALVQLDGAGALRVIDEGSVGRARYVALDEGEAVRLVEPVKDLEQQIELGRCLIDLYQRLSKLQIAAGPVPATALQKLPSGGFVVSELGTVKEQGTEPEIRELAAHTLEQIGAALAITSPWTEAIRVLRSDADGFRRARQVLDQFRPAVDRFRSRLVLVTAVIAIVCAGILLPRLWRESEPGSVAGDPATEVASTPDAGDRSGTEESPDPGQVEGQATDPQQLDEMAAAHEEKARIRLEQHARIVEQDSAWKLWSPLRDQILIRLEARELAVARQHIAALPAQPEAPEVAESLLAEKVALIQAWTWIEQREIARTQTRIESAIAQNNYEEAVILVRGLAQNLGLEQHYAAEVSRLERRGLLFAETLKILEARMEQSLMALPELSSDHQADPEGLISFPRLQRRWQSFRGSCDAIQRAARGVISAVEDWIDTGETHQWCLKGGEPFEARSTAVDERSVSLRKVGRRKAEVHRWNTVSEATLLQLNRGSASPVSADEQLLSRLRTIWGGSEAILSIARDRLADQEISQTADRLRRRQIDEWYQEAGEAQNAGDLATLRSRSIEIARWADDQQLQRLEDQLILWWSAIADRVGPTSLGLFPQAQVSGWNPETGDLQIHWQDVEKGLVGWKSTTGSTVSRRGDFVLIQGRVVLDCPFRFSTDLEVQVTGLVTREDAPNLNVVLWAGSPEALLFGVGIRPPEISSIRVGEVDVLLPAHLIIEEKLFAEGGGDFPMPAPRPKVLPGKAARLLVAEDQQGAHLEVDGTRILQTGARDRPRIGGVAIETYGVPVVIRQVTVRGMVMRQDWSELLHQKAREALRQHR